MNILLVIGNLIFICTWLPTDGFVLQAMPENNSNQDDGDLSIDLEIDDDDYEMVDQVDVESAPKDKENHGDLQREPKPKPRCSEERSVGNKRLKAKIIDTETDNSDGTQAVATLPFSFYPAKKREVALGHKTSDTNLPCGQNEIENHTPHFECPDPKCELKESDSEDFNILESIKEYFSCEKCSAEDAKGMGIRAIRCLLADYSQNRQPYNVIAVRLWNIVMIWTIVYLIIAIPLWCTKGWCCCCLYCKFFKPQETIQEAKNYLLLNPPGVLITKKGAIINYEPTEREKDCYEEFGHFIRTL